MNRTLASRLKNRVEIWEVGKKDTDCGIIPDPKKIKTVWANIVPQSGSLVNGEANTDYNNTRFKIKIRKTEILSSNYIIFQGKRYDIDYILPDYKNNSFIELFVTLKTE